MNFNLKKTAFTMLAMMLTVSALATQAKSDIYDHVDELALKIQRQTRSLLRETVHYRYTPEYRKIVSCTNELNRLATHIHDVSHFEGNLFHLKSDLRALDAEFHDLEALFDQVELNASRGYGTVIGCTAHVKRLLDSIEDSIHCLQDDVEELTRPIRVVRRPVTPIYVPTRPVYAPTRPVYAPSRTIEFSYNRNIGYGNGNRGHGHSRGHGKGHDRGHGHDRGRGCDRGGSGFSIGGGSSQIHIRF